MAYRTTKKWNWTAEYLTTLFDSLTKMAPDATLVSYILHFAKAVAGDFGTAQAVTDFTESDYTGYSDQAIVAAGGVAPAWSQTLILDTMSMGIGVSVLIPCTADEVAPGQSVVAAYLTNALGTVLVGYEIFDSPVPILYDGDFCQYDLAIPIASEQTINP